MPSLLRRIKATKEAGTPEAIESDEDRKQPSRQASIAASTASNSSGRKDSGASFTQRVSRQLSLPSTSFRRRKSSAAGPAQYNDQADCLFFAKLPYELREHVYLFITESDDWNIELRKVSDDPKERKKQQKLKAKKVFDSSISDGFRSFLKMIRTCKAIHEEMTALLFEKAHVKIPSLLTFGTFLQTTPEERLAELRHVSLDVLFPYLLFHEKEGGPCPDQRDPSKIKYYSRDIWTQFCDALAQLPRLRTLEIRMYAKVYKHLHPHWPDRPSGRLWDAIAEPLMAIEGCETFIVEVSWPVDEVVAEVERPFVLKQHDSRTDEDGSASDGEGDGNPGVPFVYDHAAPVVISTT